jgi:phage baseplate assembly protein W
LTNHYERKFRPTFGANIRKYLFENLTPITLEVIKMDIISAIKNFESRAEIIDVIVSGANDNNSVNVTITFSIINSLQVTTLSTTLTMDRVR